MIDANANALRIQGIVASNATLAAKRLLRAQSELATAMQGNVIIQSVYLDDLITKQAAAGVWQTIERAFKRTNDFPATLAEQLEDLHDNLTTGGSGRSTSQVANAYTDAATEAMRQAYRVLRSL